MGASGQSEMRRPRTEGSGNHVATEVRMAGQGIMRITASKGLTFSMHRE